MRHTLIWTAQAVAELKTLTHRDMLGVLNNVAMLAEDPFPPLARVAFDEQDQLCSLRVGAVLVTYEVVQRVTVRVIGIERI